MDKNNKVLLVSLRSPFLDSDRVMPHLSILYLKSVLDQAGVECQIEDAFDFDNLEKYKGFDYFGISALTPQRQEAEKILKTVKENFSSAKVVIGGAHPTFYQKACEPLGYDYIVTGDGEKSLLNILQTQPSERVLRHEMSEAEMNQMPIPYRTAEFLSQYKYLIDGLPATTMMTSRGCPFNCAFCENAQTKVRFYNKEFVEAEIKNITDIGFKAIMFFDDLFAINQPRVEELCSVIKKYDIKFRCFGHAHLMTEPIAKILAEAGCVETGVGMESGAQEILDIVKRPRITVEQLYNYVKTCHKYGIRVKGFFILGLPGETKETIKKTEEFIANSGVNDFDLTTYYPYHGTEIRDHMEKYDISFEADSDAASLGYYKGKCGQAESVVRTSALSAQEIAAERDRIFNLYKKIK